MKTTEVHDSTETRKQTITSESLPAYSANGEEANPSPLLSDRQAEGPKPTPVTAKRVWRGRLWESGILAHEDKSFVLGPIDEDLSAKTIHSNPQRKPEELHLRPNQELIFVPSGPEERGDEMPPLHVHRWKKVVRLRPDTAARYENLYRLLTAAECTPNSIGEDFDRLTWALVYESIRAAKRAKRILRETCRLAA